MSEQQMRRVRASDVPQPMRQAQEEGITEIWSLAEYFNVPEDFMRRVLAFYENVQ